MRRSARATRAPTRLELDVSDTALQQALRKSLLETTRVTLAVPEAPVFRPTVEEFDDPLAYISSIQGSAAAAGIAKIVPPPGWRRPKLDLNVQQLFTTKRQQVHALQEGLPFAEGQRYNQQTYRTYAEAFTIAWQQLHPELAAAAAEAGPAAATKLLEDQYWRIVERVGSEEVVVDYANDIDTQKYGSGFGPWAGKWDLSKLVSAPQSALQQLGFSVEGLTHPWLYFGALFATFCWHTEDHFLYSLNYLHEGAAKTWYGVPGSASRRFEDVMRTSAPERFSEERDLLHQLITLLPPSLLAAQGVRVVHTVQEPGEFVVTFPKAYHCGFSHGWNASEAVNFATLDWLPFGLEAARRYAKGPGKRPAVFSHDKLLWELCEDALEAARLSNGALLRAAPPAAAKQHSQPLVRPQVGKDGKPIDPVAIANYGISLAPAAREASPAAPPPPPPKPRPLPPPQGRRVAHFTPAQIKQLAEALQIVTTTELKARGDLRTEGCRDATWFGGSCAAGEAASCHICGAQPYLSAVTCSCNPAELRCLAHSHIGCTCGWQHKSLLQRLPDPALSHARREMKDLALQGRHVHAVLAKRAGIKSAASLQAGEVPRARPSVKQPAELVPPAAAAAAHPAAAGAAAGAAQKATPAPAAGAAAVAPQQRSKRRTPPPGQQGKPSAKRSKVSPQVKAEEQPAGGSGATKASIAAAGAMRQAPGPAAANTAGQAAGPQRLSGVQKRARMRMEAKLKAASGAKAAAAQPLAGAVLPAQPSWAATAAATVRIVCSGAALAAADGGTSCSRDSSPAIVGGATGGGSGVATDSSGFTPDSSLTPISSGPAAIPGGTSGGSSSAPSSSGPAASGSRSTSPSSGPVASSSPAADSGSPAAVPKVEAATGAEPKVVAASPDTGAERVSQSQGTTTPRRKRPRKLQLTDRDDPALHRAPDGRALSELSLAEAAALLAQQPRAIGQPSLWMRALRLAAGQPRFIKTSPKQPRQPQPPTLAGAGNAAAEPGTPAAEAPNRLHAAKQLKTGVGAAHVAISCSGPGMKASG